MQRRQTHRPESARSKQGVDASVWNVVAVAMLGSLLAQLDATIINVSLSSLASNLHTTLANIQWVTSGYLLALTFALPLNGWLIERIGAKTLYLWCFSIFTISSMLCGLSWSATSLIVFRLLQGASGGLLAPMAQLMMKRAAGDQFTRIAGYAAIPVLLGPALGPVIAGLILHVASWRWLFLVNLPVGVLAIALAAFLLPKDKEKPLARKLDWFGLALLSPSLVLILLGSDHIAQPVGRLVTATGTLLLIVFVWVEKRKGDAALIDLALFRRRAFSVASAIQFLWNGVMFAGQMLVPIFLIRACGESPAMVGWMLAPLGLGMMITVPSLGFLTTRFGERGVAIAGAFVAFLSTLVLAVMAIHGVDNVIMAASLFMRGVGLGAIGLPVISLAYASIGRDALPMATTALNIVQRIGGPTLTTFCALFLSSVLQEHSTHFGLNAWGEALMALVVLHAILGMVTVMLPRSTPG